MRIHELAKELNVTSTDIIQMLNTAEKTYRPVNGLSEEEEKKVRANFSGDKKSEKSPKERKDADIKPEETKKQIKEDKKEKEGKVAETSEKKEKMTESVSKEKKHKISQLYFPQNSDKNKREDNRKVFNRQKQPQRVQPVAQPSERNENKETQFKKHDAKEAQVHVKEKQNFRPVAEAAPEGGQSFGDKRNRRSDRKKEYESKKEERENLNYSDQKQGKHEKHKDKNKSKDKEKESLKAEQPIEKPKKKEEVIKHLILPDYLTIKQLADMLKKQPGQLVKDLFLKGQVVTINQEIDYETAEEIALEYDCLCDREEKVDVIAELLKEEEEDISKMTERPPVVAVMGHVDHGKTSLLDAIRETNVTDKESGGITQKIGAYQVKTASGRPITFLDTPGHEAFTSMRMRGAQSTDIAILVVAADDGVMPQTVEAINHAKSAGVEIIVAVNKIDKPTANVEKVKQELMEHELVPEEWGGSTVFCPVSAHTGEGIEDLLEMIMLTADVLELKANKKRMARGIVIEAELDKGRGVVATALIQKGTLHVGDSIAAGSSFGKIRAMLNDHQKRIKEAGPSTPVEILGLNEVPNAGEILMAFGNEKEARNFAGTFVSEEKKKMVDKSRNRMSLDDLFDQIKAGTLKELKIIVKADVQGSVEAIKQSLEKLSNDEVVVKIIHGGVGNINESDVILASASNAIILGFNVKPDNQAKDTADTEDVDIRLYNVIYDAIDDVEAALKGMLEPIYEERVIGHAEIKMIFKASGVGNIAGAIVTDGKITSKSTVKITRDGEEIFSGPIASLKHFKDEVKEVKGGTECGLVFEGFNDIAEGDIVEASEMFEIPRN